MNIDDYTRINHKRKKNTSDNKIIKYLRFLITRSLLSIILVLVVAISIKINARNKELLNTKLFNETMEFTKINKWYQDKFGKILPSVDNESTLVFSDANVTNSKYEKYLDGVKITYDKNNPIAILMGGIVVFIGDKDNYGKTVIIQGNDGINYYYGNITNINVNLYDYLEKDTLIGESLDNYIYLVLEKDGQYLNYEEYISKV